MSAEEAARQRLAAIESLQAQLATNISAMERQLLEGLLTRLQDVLSDPSQLPPLLDEFAQQVHLPVLTFFGQSLLELPTLTLSYFGAIGIDATDYAALRAPLQDYIRTVFGIGADGVPLPTGYLATYLGDQTVKRELLAYSYRALTSGTGLQQYRAGLTELITGGADSGGLYSKLYRQAYDVYNESDRILQQAVAEKVGFTAYLYLGGIIKTSRAFCIARNGKVFLESEIDLFGTSKDAYGGYTNKAAGEFNGKPDAYSPRQHLGGHGCRHGLNSISNTTAMSLRPELKEDDTGKLVLG